MNYVASLKEETILKNLKKYTKFRGLYFEIQVKTILDHAWSEIDHDRNYRRTKDFPQETDIPRRFRLTAGALEIVDNEFQRLATEIAQYQNTTSKNLRKRNMNIKISAYILRKYLTKRFRDIPGFIPLFLDIDNDLDELNSLGIKTIG
jgi:putative GTP pyrophosphokinase